MKNKIKKYRLEKGWTQSELGKKIGVIKQQIYIWEKGLAEPRISTLKKIAKIFKIKIEKLL